MKQAKADILSGPIMPALLKFVIPILISSVIQQLYTTTDRVIVGRFVNKEGLAAVGVSFPIIFLLSTALMGLFTGSSILLGYAVGAKNDNYARQVVDTTYILAAVVAAAVTVVGYAIAAPLMRWLRVPQEIYAWATVYLRIIFIGVPGMVLYYGASALSRAVGDSKTPLYYFTGAAVANVLLDLLFIVVFRWGPAGSAWATVLTQGSAGVLQLLHFKRKRELLNLRFKPHWSSAIAQRMVRLGGMTAIQQATVAISVLLLQRFINAHGLLVVAGFVAGSQVDTYGRMAMLSTMIGLAPFVSQNLGAGQEQRARRALVTALIFNLIVSLVFFFLMLFFGRQVVGWFNPDPGMTKVGAEFLRISSGFYWLISLYFCVVGFLRGSGATLVPALTSVLGTLLLPFLATYLGNKFGYLGLFYVFPATWFLMASILALYFWSGHWRGKLRLPVQGGGAS